MEHAPGIADAIALYRQGHHAPALALLRTLPGDLQEGVDGLNLAAACARALGQPAEAERCWRLALARDPAHAASWNNLGVLLQQQGRAPEARDAYGRARDLAPGYADAHYNLALLAQQEGDTDAAEAGHRHTLALAPGHAGANANLALLLQRRGRLEEAERHYGAASAADPRDAEVLRRRADLLQRLGRRVDAETCYLAALALRPDSAELHNNLAVLYAGAKRLDAAEAAYLRALGADPRHADAWHNLGQLYTAQRRLAQAEQALRTCAALRPDDPEVLNSLGNVCQVQHRGQEAEALYRRALVLAPGNARTLNNLAALLQREGRAVEAEAGYRAAIGADPAYPEARWNLGFLLLARGRLEEGWPWMEARHDPALARPIATRPQPGYPQWQGEALAGRSIVVWPEQGFGDTIQFVRYLPWLKGQGASRVTLVCQDALLPLLRDVAGADAVIPLSATGQLAPHDFWVFMLSLPMHAGTTLAAIPAPRPYLSADPARTARWHDRLAAAGAGVLRVGLVWKGFGGHVNDANRSLPGLDCLAPLWDVPRTHFFSLQRGMDGAASSVDPLPSQLTDLGADIADFADTAAIVASLDLVICVDTALAHVAGALGKRCWVLLPAVHPDWRWMEERPDSPWYPDAVTLYRQQRQGNWDDVVARVAADLVVLVNDMS